MDTRHQGGALTIYKVNRDNWPALARSFMAKKDGTGFLLAVKEGKLQGVEFKATMKQWGAWRHYFRSRGIPTRFMDLKARLSFTDTSTFNPHCWTVPCEWPHEFDGEATVQGDHRAGEAFMLNFRPERLDMASKAQREATAAAMRNRMPGRPKYGTYDPQESSCASTIDVDRLLKDHETDFNSYLSRNGRSPNG